MTARFYAPGYAEDYVPVVDATAGTVFLLADGRAAVNDEDHVAGRKSSVTVVGHYKVDSASATTFSKGEEVWYDSSSGLAVSAGSVAGAIRLGLAAYPKVSGETSAIVSLNADSLDSRDVQEFDCANDSDTRTIVPAESNPSGLILTKAYGEVTEAFAGATEDQGIILIEDEDANLLATLTPSDAGADAVGDVVWGYKLQSSSTGDALKRIAAGKSITARVSQNTSGAGAAGKMKIRVSVE